MTALRSALDPASIAIVGASDNPNKVGGRPIHYLAKFGFKGRVYPVNPSRSEVQGHICYPRLDALPEPPELVVIALSGDDALEAVATCAALGVKVVVITGSGFGDADTPERRQREDAVLLAARQAGMRIVGPNSQGLANFGSGTVTSFSSLLADLDPMAGQVAILSQSGAFSVVPLGFLRQRGIGVRHAHATGNELDLTVGELAAAVASDTEVKLMLLYLESITSTQHLEELAAVALKRRLPIIALKSGRSEAGRKAAASHTGALASEDRVVDAFFAQHGIWRARTTPELIEATQLYLKGLMPKGRRLVSVSNSGAFGVMTADAAADSGLVMPTPMPQTVKRLEAVLPRFASAENPVDLTAAILSDNSLLEKSLGILADDPTLDMVLLGLPVSGPGMDVAGFARAAASFEATTGKLIAVAATQPSVLKHFADLGVPAFSTESEAVSAFGQYLGHHDLMAAAARRSRVPTAAWGRNLAGGRMLNEADSLSVLERGGIPVVSHRLCESSDEAVAAFHALGGRVVVKGCSADIAHKSELGLVRVGIDDPDRVAALWLEMKQTIESHGHQFDGLLIAEMESGRREILVGAHRDPVFGPVVVVGDGGKYVETFRDTALLTGEFTREDVQRALATLRIAPLFAGVRGEPPMDLDSLCDVVLNIGAMMADEAAALVSVDMNPVMLRAAGQGCVVVDAVVYRG